MAQLAMLPFRVCDKTILTTLYLSNFFITMTKKMTEVMGYEAPNFDVVLAVVERGFEASYGDYGEAGDGFDTNNNGDF
jgi:predicted transglutaminase-like protease